MPSEFIHITDNTQEKNTQFQPKNKPTIQYIPSPSHSFDVIFAKEHSVEEAIIINHFVFWISFNKDNNRNFIQGRYWMFQTLQQIAAHYPYWSKSQIFRIIEKLVRKGILITANHNKNKSDRTQWYALGNEENFPSFRNQNHHIPKLQNVYKDKAPKKEDTKKATAADSVSATTAPVAPAAFAPASPAVAAPSASKEKAADKEPAAAKKAAPTQKVPVKIYPCLQNVDISEPQKQWLSKMHTEPVVEKAVAWATNPLTTPRKSIVASLKWFCAQPEDDRPKDKEDIEKQVPSNRALAKHWEANTYSSSHRMIALHQRVEIVSEGQSNESIEIQYTHENFEEFLRSAMSKKGFKPIIKKSPPKDFDDPD